MKTPLKNLAIIFAFTLSINTYGYTADRSERALEFDIELVGNKTEGQYDLILNGVKDEVIFVSIFDQNNNLVYDEILSPEENLKASLNLRSLTAGNYTFEIYNGIETVSKDVYLSK